MSARWQQVHLRLSTTLPVRTHTRREPPAPQFDGRPAGNLAAFRRERVRRWLAEDPDTRQGERDLAGELQISRTMVQKHIRAIRAEEGNGTS